MENRTNLILEPVFQPDEIVYIVGLERFGRVGLLRYDGRLVEYFVHWWDEGKRQAEWLHPSELEAKRV